MHDAAEEALQEQARQSQKQQRVQERLDLLEKTIASTDRVEEAFIAHSRLPDPSTEDAKEAYELALELKRIAARMQIALADATDRDAKLEMKEKEAAANANMERIAAQEAATQAAEAKTPTNKGEGD